MTDFKVSYPELRGAAQAFAGLERDAQAQQRSLDSVQLGQPDFGRIPWLQTRVYEAFTEHTRECDQALAELTEALRATSEGLDANAEAYEAYERAAAEAIQQFFDAMVG